MKTSLASLIFLVPFAAGCGEDHAEIEGGEIFPKRHTVGMPVIPSDAIMAEAPPFKNPDTEDCSDCHDPDFMEVDTTVRVVAGDHEGMTPFAHAVGRIWCLDCHDAENRDMLRLSNGELLEFEETPLLCGQCHGATYREWVAGVHGKRSGYWNGVKTYQVCSNCHDPHAPLFPPLVPEAAPKRPEVTR